MFAAVVAPCTVALRATPVVAARNTARRALRVAARINNALKQGSSADDSVVQDDSINPLHWTRTQEVSNGRAAIAGLIAALISERISGYSVEEQLLGGSAQAPCAKPAFLAVAIGFVLITGAERSVIGNQPISGNPQASLFSPEQRLLAGRAAMVGFVALLVWEKLNGTAFFA